jgi:hypothetical protein
VIPDAPGAFAGREPNGNGEESFVIPNGAWPMPAGCPAGYLLLQTIGSLD